MNSAEKEFILKEWNDMSTESIVKDVATKGSYINLAIDYLFKRMKASSIEETKNYFRLEVNNYVERLLLNKQVFKAEYVLKNVKCNSIFYFYEFHEKNEKCNDVVKSVIINYLKKTLGDEYEKEVSKMNVEFKTLKICENDTSLKLKYKPLINIFTLQCFHEVEYELKKYIFVDVCFRHKCEFLIGELDKHVTWTYLIEHNMFVLLVKWIDIVFGQKQSDNVPLLTNNFENILLQRFTTWELDGRMITQIKVIEDNLPNYLVNTLAKYSIDIGEKEESDIQLLVERLISSESLNDLNKILSVKPNSRTVESILNRKLKRFLIEEFVNRNGLIEAASLYPDLRSEMELCCYLKDTIGSDLAQISSKISAYILINNPKFLINNHLTHFTEILIQEISADEYSSNTYLAKVNNKIPQLQTILQNFESNTGFNYEVTMDDLMRRLELVDLKSNTYRNYYGKTTNLDLSYIFYIKQHRSAFAIYVFLIEQLLAFAKITNGQIMCACTMVAELAINNFEDFELVTHCFAFMEMLNVNTTHLRAYLKCLRWIRHGSKTVFGRRTELSTTALLENIFLKRFKTIRFQLRNFEAIRMVFDVKREKLPASFLISIAKSIGWFQMIAFAMYFNYNLGEVVEACNQALQENNVGINIKKAIRWEIAEKSKHRNISTLREHKRKLLSKNENIVTSDTMSSSISSTETVDKLKQSLSKFITSDDVDLFSAIIQCVQSVKNPRNEQLGIEQFHDILKNSIQSQSITPSHLLQYSNRLQWPILALLSAKNREFNVQNCWIIWMITSMESWEFPGDTHNLQSLSKSIIEFSVKNGFTRTLRQSMDIFFPDNNFNTFIEYLERTKKLDFSTATTELLQKYLMFLSQDKVEMLFLNDRAEILTFSIVLLVHHLQCGFESQEYQRLMLTSLCQSTIGDIGNIINFSMVSKIIDILSFTCVRINITSFMRDKWDSEEMKLEYERICEQLMACQSFSKAKEIADLFNFPKENIIYESWVSDYDIDDKFDLTRCEVDIEKYSLSPELVINFYIYVADRLDYGNPRKYSILKKILDVIKKHHLFPNESFDRDRIEYEMVMCFLKNSLDVEDIEMYYSEYYQCIMSKERFVLYKSFLELKEMAGIDDLTISNQKALNNVELEKLNALMNRLLDDSDIVQALRMQSIFNHRPLDLHYIVFCMALAEGLATLCDLSGDQRKMLSDKSAASKFNRRAFQSTKLSQTSASSSPQSRPIYLDASDVSTTFDFEEIPSREKQDVLEALQSVAARITHGSKIGHRIVMISRAAMYLDKEYVDVLKIKDPYLLLRSAIDEDCLNKLVVISDVMASMEMTYVEIADFLADQIATSIIRSRFYLLQTPSKRLSVGQNLLWGYNLDKEFRLFLELCPNTSLLGNDLLKYCDALKLYRKMDLNNLDESHLDDNDTLDPIKQIFEKVKLVIGSKGLSHKKQNTINVELLIKAHECFVHECYMEGIAVVLQRAKILNSVLANAKSWNLIVKMLIGIGRYRDMYYCFETLIKNEQFESLLGQFDDDKSKGLKQAIISYLNEHCPEDTENYRLAVVHFSICKELSQMSESNAKSIIEKVIAEHERKNIDSQDSPTYLKCSQTVVSSLSICMDEYANAAENYLLDNKLHLAQRAAYKAELVALQIDLINKEKADGQCICVLNIQSSNVFRSIVNNNLTLSQSIILSHAYPFEINWSEAMFNQYILQLNEQFLTDFCNLLQLTDEMIENLVKNFQIQTNVTIKMEQHISNLVEMVNSITVKYRLSSLLGLKRMIAQLINENSLFYLKDANYGRNEEVN